MKFSTRWKNIETRLLGHTRRAQHNDPLREIFFESGILRSRREHCTKVGKPRRQWFIETCQNLKIQINPYDRFDINNLDHMNFLARRAHKREYLFHTRYFTSCKELNFITNFLFNKSSNKFPIMYDYHSHKLQNRGQLYFFKQRSALHGSVLQKKIYYNYNIYINILIINNYLF